MHVHHLLQLGTQRYLVICHCCNTSHAFSPLLLPQMAQDGSKMAPRLPKMAPRWPKTAPRWPQMAPSSPQGGTKMVHDMSRWPQVPQAVCVSTPRLGTAREYAHASFIENESVNKNAVIDKLNAIRTLYETRA